MPTIDPPALRDYVERIFVATGSPRATPTRSRRTSLKRISKAMIHTA